MNRLRNDRGTALIATLSIAMILLPLGAFVVMQTRTDLAIQYNLRSEVEAFYVAEAGLEHAISEIQPGLSFDPLMLGTDRIPGSADDGVFPFTEGPPGDFLRAPFHYDVRVTRLRADLIQLASQGSGRNGAARTLQALVTRAPLPFTPAALYVEGSLAGFELGANFQISGFDQGEADPPGPAVAALGTPIAGAEAALRQRYADASAQQLLGSGGTPSITTPVALGLDAYAASIASAASRVVLPAGMTNPDALGSETAPQVSVAGGDLTVSGQATGCGILVVRGTLYVGGAFSFRGLVLALGGIVLESGSDVHVRGALWRAAGLDDRLQLHGGGGVAYDSTALAEADRAFPALLPHAAAVAGWQEDL